jgi:hypothetical protein
MLISDIFRDLRSNVGAKFIHAPLCIQNCRYLVAYIMDRGLGIDLESIRSSALTLTYN